MAFIEDIVMSIKVRVERKPLVLPTYRVGEPEKNPLFFEKRVYQGSSGKVYPVPFIDKVYDTPEPVQYDAIEMDNGIINMTLLPEIGGRIFSGQDRSNGGYDFFYRQDVIKPALVGLAGPWISGGVEFNWPQHHRPGTYLPTDVFVEDCDDGSYIVWFSTHDPIQHMKGMHGICVRPDSALIELKARLYNRTPVTQTFLWWANVAARVDDKYQSFFPPDVHYVADHAVRAQSSFPVAHNHYYGVDYAARPGANDLSWYKNIPVPTSYMVCGTNFDHFGGYDFGAQGGFVHVANRHIAPGKKQWTWGNHAFGWAWDRELTDVNGPYVELMAGVYTDNQPDFTYIAPYETKTFSQFWWPYQKIGPVQNASKEAALRLVVQDDHTLDIGVAVSGNFPEARVILRQGDKVVLDRRVDLRPDAPWQDQTMSYRGDDPRELWFGVENAAGKLLCTYRPVDGDDPLPRRPVAEAPPSPQSTGTVDKLVLTAEHLDQSRHPTRYPEPYLEEALRRDPAHAQANLALGKRKLAQGVLDEAYACFEKSIQRLTAWHPNPCTGEAHYYKGLVCRYLGKLTEAYACFYKATWDFAWRAPSFYELALLDCRQHDFETAIAHCNEALATNTQNNKAYILKALAMEKIGLDGQPVLQELLAVDALDHWARYASGDVEGMMAYSRNDAQTVLDLAYDYADAGMFKEAATLLRAHHTHGVTAVAVPNPGERSVMTHYSLAWMEHHVGNADGVTSALAAAAKADPDYFFPSRLHDQLVLEWAIQAGCRDRNAAYGLGNLYYDRKRHEDAMLMWRRSLDADERFATAYRCLGIAYWNVRRDRQAARDAYQHAIACAPQDARIFAEYDQLREKMDDAPAERLEMMLANMDLVLSRDDATVSLCALYNLTGRPEKALQILQTRRFHPWEGGEGKVLRQYTLARLLLGQQELDQGNPEAAHTHFAEALHTPENLGESYHMLQAKADVSYWQGKALQALGRTKAAHAAFEAAASESGDFQNMAVTEHSELSYYKGLALFELGRGKEAEALFADMQAFAEREMESEGTIDYFATSLPLLLVFEDDLTELRHRQGRHLLELAQKGLEQVGAH